MACFRFLFYSKTYTMGLNGIQEWLIRIADSAFARPVTR